MDDFICNMSKLKIDKFFTIIINFEIMAWNESPIGKEKLWVIKNTINLKLILCQRYLFFSIFYFSEMCENK